MAFNPKALESSQRRAMEESQEPVVAQLHERMERVRQEAAGVPRIADRRAAGTKEVRSEVDGHGKPTDAEMIADQIEALKRADLTEADFLANPGLYANNAIPSKRLERMREVLATYTIRPSELGVQSFTSLQEARAALVGAWNNLVQVSTAPGRATPQSMTQRSNYAEATANALREVERLLSEEELKPKVVAPQQRSRLRDFRDKLKRAAGF